MSVGFKYQDVLDMHLDTFYYYIRLVNTHTNSNRASYIVDTVHAIVGAFKPKKIKEYLDSLRPDA